MIAFSNKTSLASPSTFSPAFPTFSLLPQEPPCHSLVIAFYKPKFKNIMYISIFCGCKIFTVF